MQHQTGFGHQLKVVAASDIESSGLVEAADTIGVAYETTKAGEAGMLLTCGEFGRTEIIPREEWHLGQRLYWHETLKRFTTRETHWPAGRAGEDKAGGDNGTTFGIVQLDGPDRKWGEILAPFRYEHLQELGGTNFGVQGDYVLRDFGENVQIIGGEVISSGLAAGTVTIALGNGAGSSGQIMAAAPASTLGGITTLTIEPPVAVNRVVMRLAGDGAFTAGLLIVRLLYVAAS